VARLVLLDTNALLMPFQFRINLKAELDRLVGDADIAVPTPVLAEIKGLAARDKDARSAARLAASFRVIEGHGSADDSLLELATEHRAVVVTNDAALLERLEASRVPRVTLRSRNHLVVHGL
jgi:hypothetical protein